MYFFLAFFWYKYYISILQIQICIILFDVPPLKHTKYNNLEYRVWVQCDTANNSVNWVTIRLPILRNNLHSCTIRLEIYPRTASCLCHKSCKSVFVLWLCDGGQHRRLLGDFFVN